MRSHVKPFEVSVSQFKMSKFYGLAEERPVSPSRPVSHLPFATPKTDWERNWQHRSWRSNKHAGFREKIITGRSDFCINCPLQYNRVSQRMKGYSVLLYILLDFKIRLILYMERAAYGTSCQEYLGRAERNEQQLRTRYDIVRPEGKRRTGQPNTTWRKNVTTNGSRRKTNGKDLCVLRHDEIWVNTYMY